MIDLAVELADYGELIQERHVADGMLRLGSLDELQAGGFSRQLWPDMGPVGPPISFAPGGIIGRFLLGEL